VQAHSARRESLKLDSGIINGIKQLEVLYATNASEKEEEPIFLLSAGWRTGSTLLQRLIMSDTRVLIWGEPYHECGLIQALAETTQAFRPGWPKQKWFFHGESRDHLPNQWIANLFPPIENWRKSHRALFETLFANPAMRAGAVRWGIKEVRLTIDDARYLRWLFPKGRFLFLHRHPLDAYLSYRRRGGGWYNTFPHQPIITPTAFGRHWRERVEGFIQFGGELDGLIVRYEDIVSGRTSLEEIENHLDIRIDRAILNIKVDGLEYEREKKSIGPIEKCLLKRAAGPIAKALGYEW
jgi:hypothetical protein